LALLFSLPTESRAQAANQIGEVIVTARKREESILNVPVIESVVSQAKLERLQVSDVRDLPSLVPGLGIGRGVNALGAQISIRGIGTIALDAGVDQSVAYNIDGMSIATGLALQSSLFDVGQTEVLKGPQSLFYGKSVTGGVLSMRTADPTNKVEIIARAAYEAESVTPRGELIVSGPVTDTLKLRLAGMYSQSDGYFFAVGQPQPGTGGLAPPDKRAPGQRNSQIRGTALWNPSDKFSARLKINAVEDHALLNNVLEPVACPDGIEGPFGLSFLGGGQPCKLTRNLYTVVQDPAVFPNHPYDGTPFLDTYQRYGTLELNYRIRPELTLTSTTGYYHVAAKSWDDGTGSTYAGDAFTSLNNLKRHNVSQEIRLNSDYAGPLNFTVGGYYEGGEINYLIRVYGNTIYGLPPNLIAVNPQVSNRTLSAFGQLRWKIMPTLELAVGGRYSDEKRSEIGYDLLSGVPVPIPIVTPNVHPKKPTPDVTLTYRPTQDLTWFTAFREAYKSGGYALSTQPIPGVGYDNAFGDEKAIGGETGIKSRWLDRRLLVDIAAYYYRFKGLQVGIVEQPRPGGIVETTTQNAGSAQTYGIDFDMSWYPQAVEGLVLNAALNWNRAKFLQLNNVPCYGGQTIAMGCDVNFSSAANGGTGGFTAQDLSGTPLVRAPEWQGTVGFTYDIPLHSGFKFTLTNNTSFSSKYVTTLAGDYPNQGNYQPGFAMVDLSAMLTSPDQKWELAIIGKNINNKITAGTCTNSNFQYGAVFGGQITGSTGRGPAGIDEIGCFADPGREVWFRVTYRPLG
jgi:outer membrane receptor protein involved in Fe transport